MSKKGNFEKLFKTLKESGWLHEHSQEIYDALAGAYKKAHGGGSYADYLDSLSPVAYQAELDKNIRPFVKDFALRIAHENPGTYYDRDNLRNFLKATSSTIDREHFLNILGRKAEEFVDKNGNKIKKDRHIGELSPEDYDNLYLEGFDKDYADELANKYRNEYMSDFAKRILSERPKEMQMARNEVVDEYNKSPMSGLMKAIAPEVYAEGLRAGYNGTDIPSDRLRKAVLLDAGRNAGLVASAMFPNPFAVGLGVAGTEMTFNSMSPNYKQDPSQAITAGVAAATIPTIFNRVAGTLQKVPVRSLQRALRDATKKYRRGELSPAMAERMGKDEAVDKAIETYMAAKAPGSGVRAMESEKALKSLVNGMNNSYMSIQQGTAGKWNEQTVSQLLQTREGQGIIRNYLAEAPSRADYVAKTDVMRYPFLEGGLDELRRRIMYEKWLDAAQREWPLTTGDFIALPASASQRMLNYVTEMGLGAVNSAGGVVEPMSTRIGSVSPYSPAENGGLQLIEDWKSKYSEK